LSQQIRQLEEELGVVLLQRDSRPLRLTDAGMHFLDRARALLASLEVAVADTRRIGRGQSGRLAIGFVGSAMFTGLPDTIFRFREASPEVELVLNEMLAAEIAEGLQQRRIDVGFTRPPLSAQSGFAQRMLLEEPYMAAIPSHHPLAGRNEIALAELVDDRFILYPAKPEPTVTGLIVAACRTAGFTPQIAQEVLHLQTAISLVAAGAGVSLVPSSAARGQTGRGVAYVLLKQPTVMAPLAVAWRDNDASPALHCFLNMVSPGKKTALE
jgi:LysR family transcriptional regulator, benzoate and cis,cis-muconate-responsive activator of ben and cat genes